MAGTLFGSGRRTQVGLGWIALVLVAMFATCAARAQDTAAPAAAAPVPFDAAGLQQLVGPIALYADDLVAIVLPASAYPLQIVAAARFLDARDKDPAVKPDANWDDSVVALLNYPEVLRKMNADLDWTADLGEAFVYQQAEVLDAVQQFRKQARAAGNLRSDDRQTVTEEDDVIEVEPADPQVIYVPYYDPVRVVRYYEPAYNYYPYGYPVYYYPYPYGYSFSSGFFWGVTTAFVIGWNDHYLNYYPRGYRHHPYYGHSYYDSYYARRSYHHEGSRYTSNYAWQPREHWGARPHQQQRYAYQNNYPARAGDSERSRHSAYSGSSRYSGADRQGNTATAPAPRTTAPAPRTQSWPTTTTARTPRDSRGTYASRGAYDTRTYDGSGGRPHQTRGSDPQVGRRGSDPRTAAPPMRPSEPRRYNTPPAASRGGEPPRQSGPPPAPARAQAQADSGAPRGGERHQGGMRDSRSSPRDSGPRNGRARD